MFALREIVEKYGKKKKGLYCCTVGLEMANNRNVLEGYEGEKQVKITVIFVLKGEKEYKYFRVIP